MDKLHYDTKDGEQRYDRGIDESIRNNPKFAKYFAEDNPPDTSDQETKKDVKVKEKK